MGISEEEVPVVGGAGAGGEGADQRNEDGRTAAQRLAAVEAALEAITAVVGPDGVVRARQVVVGQPTGAVVTIGATGGYATVELRLPGEAGADNKVVLFASRGGDGEDTGEAGENGPRLGAAVYGGGTCRAGIEIAQDEGGGWLVGSLGEVP
ncbi:MAG TPA: hypothetical protein VHB02_04110 [Acidimicrobiales bacterium]|nr:hypothetical protein [Acidimicrobiales bacterium]